MSHQTTVNEILLRAQVKELASEFRRLAAEVKACADASPHIDEAPDWYIWEQRRIAFAEAAKMLEEKLNG